MQIPVCAAFNPDKIIGVFNGNNGVVKFFDPVDVKRTPLALSLVIHNADLVGEPTGSSIVANQVTIKMLSIIPADTVLPGSECDLSLEDGDDERP